MNYDRFLTRVFDTQEKRMLYQGASFSYQGTLFEFRGITDRGIQVTQGYHNGEIIFFILPFSKTLDRFIPMQCYGLPDKKKKLAYESDIFKVKSHDGEWKFGIIERDDDAECLFLSSLERMDEEYNTYNFHDCGIGDLEIIGNIHENPELTKELMEEKK